ncbi:hypothetical protein [Micromonospora sp. NPDC005313]|uniref:hypothetical protein n=1 Tax=Micromonospora sp. NPDC005313 TaxID=3154296 RepID=UPI0033A60CCA
MRQEEQQVTQDHPEAVRSAPVPVPQPGEHADADRRDADRRDADRRDADRADAPEDALDDRGTFDDPAVATERGDTEADERRDAVTDERNDAEVDETRAYDAGELPDAADRREGTGGVSGTRR